MLFGVQFPPYSLPAAQQFNAEIDVSKNETSSCKKNKTRFHVMTDAEIKENKLKMSSYRNSLKVSSQEDRDKYGLLLTREKLSSIESAYQVVKDNTALLKIELEKKEKSICLLEQKEITLVNQNAEQSETISELNAKICALEGTIAQQFQKTEKESEEYKNTISTLNNNAKTRDEIIAVQSQRLETEKLKYTNALASFQKIAGLYENKIKTLDDTLENEKQKFLNTEQKSIDYLQQLRVQEAVVRGLKRKLEASEYEVDQLKGRDGKRQRLIESMKISFNTFTNI